MKIADCFPAPWFLALAVVTSCSRPPAAVTPPTPEVVTMTVRRQCVQLVTELPGRTAPYRIAEIRPQVNGLIQKRLFVEGADVASGDALYQIEAAPFEAALANARAALGRAEASLPALQARAERVRLALAERAASRQDSEDAAAALNQARADAEYWRAGLETARIQLGYARIVSPIAGRIGRSTVTDGAIVTAYQPVPLATIQQLDPIYVDVPQSTTELLRLRRRLEAGRLHGGESSRNSVRLILADGTPYDQPGLLQFQDVSVDPTTGSVTLRLVFPNPSGILLPGMFVRALVETGSDDQAILVPQQAVSRDTKGDPLAMIVERDGTVARKRLVLDRAIADQWLVESGLEPGDRVIVEGLQRVRPGGAVKEVAITNGAPSGTASRATASLR